MIKQDITTYCLDSYEVNRFFDAIPMHFQLSLGRFFDAIQMQFQLSLGSEEQPAKVIETYRREGNIPKGILYQHPGLSSARVIVFPDSSLEIFMKDWIKK